MKIIPVDELIKDWTDEEKEELKDLIEECRERETRNHENSVRNAKLLQAISDHRLGELAEILYHLMKGEKSHVGRA